MGGIIITEQTLQNEIRLELSKYGKVFRINVGGFYSKDGRYIPSSLPKGFSDLIFINKGKIAFIEVKVKPNKPTAEQINFIKQMRKIGCNAGIVYSVNEALDIVKNLI